MAQKVLHKRSNELENGAAKLPAASGLSYGEIAINYKAGNEAIALKNDEDKVVSFNLGDAVWERGTGENSVQQKGTGAVASGKFSVAEGSGTTAAGEFSHAEGYGATANNNRAHAEGFETLAEGSTTHAEGYRNFAIGHFSHAEGNGTAAVGNFSHSEGGNSAYVVKLIGEGNSLIYSGTTEGESSQELIELYEKLGPTAFVQCFTNVGVYLVNNLYVLSRILSFEILNRDGDILSFKITLDKSLSPSSVNGDAHIFGSGSFGRQSHSEGRGTKTVGENSHSEGRLTIALGNNSHAEGEYTFSSGDSSHAEGSGTTALGKVSHAEGFYTSALTEYSHTEGQNTKASGQASHAEGYNTTASGDYSHAEGIGTTVSGNYSHAEGSGTTVSGYYSHAEGNGTTASGDYSHAEGEHTTASGDYSHAEGSGTRASHIAHAEGDGTKALGGASHAEGQNTTASGNQSHAEGANTTASGDFSHAEGKNTKALDENAHAEGENTIANDVHTHAEGYNTLAQGSSSHAEGYYTSAMTEYSHAEGAHTKAIGICSHAEGEGAIASGSCSHAEGAARAIGRNSHAEGNTNAFGNYSHTEGECVTARNMREHAEGYFNVSNKTSNSYGNSGNTQHSVGIGGYRNEKNAFEIMQNGDAYLYGVGGYDGTNASASTSNTLQKTLEGTASKYELCWEHGDGNGSIQPKAGVAKIWIYRNGDDDIFPLYFKGGEAVNATTYRIMTYAGMPPTGFFPIGTTISLDKITTALIAGYERLDSSDCYMTVSQTLNPNAAISSCYGYVLQEKTFDANCVASGDYSYSEGSGTTASGTCSHAEGRGTVAIGYDIDSIGGAHAEGVRTVAFPSASHAEGFESKTEEGVDGGIASHAEGYRTIAKYLGEHAEGTFNTTTILGAKRQRHSVGIGTSESDRKNAFTIFENGDTYLYGVGGYNGKNPKSASTLQQCINKMQEITWSALKSLRDSSGLTPGMQYRITDYNTTTTQANTQSAGHQFDIIVVADDNHTLNENARAVRHSGDTYFSGSTLEAWELKYDIDNDTTKFAWADSGATGRGVIYWMKDEWNNECPYDFKNIQYCKFPSFEAKMYGITHTYTKNGEVININNVNYYEYTRTRTNPGPPPPTTPLYVTDSAVTTGSALYTITNNTATQYTSATIGSVDSSEWAHYTFTSPNSKQGIPLPDSDISLDNKVQNNIIKPYHFQIFYTGSTIAPQYLNNIILRLTSTQRYRILDNVFGYNCSGITSNDQDFYNNIFNENCNGNIFEAGAYNNVFYHGCGKNTFLKQCHHNIFNFGCTGNTFSGSCYYNTFGDNCYNNAFRGNFHSNTFGNNCFSNTFGDGCDYNTFGNNCFSNTFGDGCDYNTFGGYCIGNTFGGECIANTFGNHCFSNTLGSFCKYNTFGEHVEQFITGKATGATTISDTRNYIQNLIVENGVQFVNAYCTGTTSSTNYCQNIKIGLGLKGTSSSDRLQIDITQQIGATASVTYQPANSQVINI